MTAQIEDTFLFRGDEYSLIGVKGGELISPEHFDMEAVMIHTACWRGYYATYELTEEALYLRQLTLREKNENYASIEGVEPEMGPGEATYSGLNVVVPFTGRLRLARGFLPEYYIHMGYQKASAFETVLDLTLEQGRVVDFLDRSAEMEERRGAFKKRYESGDLMETIQEAFSLDMDLV